MNDESAAPEAIDDVAFMPLGDRVIIKQVEVDTVRESGLILPDAAQERPALGKVVRIGPDQKFLRVGCEVIYSKYGGTALKIENEEFIVLRDSDVLAVRDRD